MVQISRWDRLKDMQGVMEGFVDRVARDPGVILALAGPAVMRDRRPRRNPGLRRVYGGMGGVLTHQRRTVRLVSLPMDNVEQERGLGQCVKQHASWWYKRVCRRDSVSPWLRPCGKSRPVIASAVGGIVDQIAPGTGVLLKDPSDLAVFGDTLADLLDRPKT